jgi:demethylmenaquinone methyltransferase/2-methoxy-6-polyprenyl-1,4-benzoquinol methylase
VEAAFRGLRECAPGDRVLDLAGGTGDISGLMAPLVGETRALVVLSTSMPSMLVRGRDRMLDEGHSARIATARINAEALPFPDAASTWSPSPSACATSPTSRAR